MQMHNRFAGMKPNCSQSHQIEIKLLPIATINPVQDFRSNRIVSNTVKNKTDNLSGTFRTPSLLSVEASHRI